MVPVIDIPAAYNSVQNVNYINQPAVDEYGNWALPNIFHDQGNYQLYGNSMGFNGGAQPIGFGQVDLPSIDSEYVNFSPFG